MASWLTSPTRGLDIGAGGGRGIRSLAIDDFILAPDGTFVGEGPGAAAAGPA